MADNTNVNTGTGAAGATNVPLASDDIGGVQFPRTKIVLGADGVNDGDVSSGNPMPISGTVTTGGLTDAQLRASAVPVSGPLTDTQLRATALPVSAASLPLPSGAATAAAQTTGNASLSSIDGKLPVLSGGAVPVTGGLTDTQLRASAVSVSASTLPLPTGAATESTLSALNAKIPASPATDRTTAAAPFAVRVSDGSAFVAVATSTAQATGNASLSSIDSKTPALSGGSVPVVGPVTDAQLRATAIAVSGTVTATGPLTDAQLRATAVPVNGPLTDAQLRATAVPISAASLPLPSGAATDGAAITGATMPTGGSGLFGWLSAIWKAITDRLPAALVGGRLDVNVGNTVAVSGTVTATTGGLTDAQLRATAVPVSGPLTDTQIRATPLPISGTVSTGGLTDTQLRASAVPVSGPLTDTQIRATALPVSAASLPLPSGAATSAAQTTGNATLTQIDTDLGALTETAPATDTASSGLNGRLQRISQRLTTLIGQLPGALVGGRLDINLGSATSSNLTASRSVATTSSSVSAGAQCVGFKNTGTTTVTLLGQNLLAGESRALSVPYPFKLAAIAYNATGGTLEILEVR